MRESSIVIHKGGKEERYELYIEDYVMSFLKEETGSLELSECYFYGIRESGGRKYILYGALRDKRLPYFERYDLLEEVGCRLTQAGPVFYVREKEGVYELRGYEIFYEDNQEMQNYLIDRRKKIKSVESGVSDKSPRQAAGQRKPEKIEAKSGVQHSAVSVQLCVVLIVLVAIVINSANSYDKMNDLNQSATEVFFAIENREAEEEADRPDGAVSPADETKAPGEAEPVSGKGDGAESEAQESAAPKETEESVTAAEMEGNLRDAALPDGTAAQNEADRKEAETWPEENTTEEKAVQGAETEGDGDNPDEVEALSRNVARYYEVEKGDTLYTISRKIYGDSTYVQEICELNQITDPDKIRYGQKIVLP